ncbi:GGDEF domain-containing protein [Crossiella sp. CA-258035]|uniref:GGDEF domain-containing protein n=1 Tax=Crossiella sp. CA-258035 TaxID=2981138 RepID=UPI0024BC7908|nr:GGDEF domain-containing protein [Crossiella sp. CA-258035]WHT16395.1 GGDEF domain-containing protein [Crossiella sp. CA-258035]
MTAPGSSADPVDPACQSCGHAATDRLTGLLDRWGWDERAPAELAQAAAQQDSLALLVIDIDHFKRFNDRFGHIAGDAVIKAVADTVRRSTRETDVLGRYGGHGGDEFLVLLRQTDAAEALSVAHRIRTGVRAIAVDAPSTDGGIIRLDKVTTSIGVCARVPAAEEDLTTFVVAADAALQVAKQAGRDRIRLAEDSRTPLPVPLARHRAEPVTPVRRYVPVLVGLGSALAAFAYIVAFAPPPEREEPAMAAAQLAPATPPTPSVETTVVVVTTVLAPPPPAPPPRPASKAAAVKKKPTTSKPAPATTTTEQKPLVDVCLIMRQMIGRGC